LFDHWLPSFINVFHQNDSIRTPNVVLKSINQYRIHCSSFHAHFFPLSSCVLIQLKMRPSMQAYVVLVYWRRIGFSISWQWQVAWDEYIDGKEDEGRTMSITYLLTINRQKKSTRIFVIITIPWWSERSIESLFERWKQQQSKGTSTQNKYNANTWRQLSFQVFVTSFNFNSFLFLLSRIYLFDQRQVNTLFPIVHPVSLKRKTWI